MARNALDAVLGRLKRDGEELELRGSLNFVAPITVEESEEGYDISLDESASPAGVGAGTEAGQHAEWDGTAWSKRPGDVTLEYDRTGVVAADDAIAEFLALGAGRRLRVPAGFCRITQPIELDYDCQAIIGDGTFNGTTFLVDNPSDVDHFVINAQHCTLSNFRITSPTRVYTSGFAIKFNGAYQPMVERVQIDGMGNGIWGLSTVLAEARDVKMSGLFGLVGVLAIGTVSGATDGFSLSGACVFGQGPYQATITGAGGPWASSTAYATGFCLWNNSKIYQAVTGGTSASSGSGPTAIPGTNVSDAHTTDITDGTVTWRYIGPAIDHIVQDSYAHSLIVGEGCGTINGGRGIVVKDTANTGTSFPFITRIFGFEADHPFDQGILLSAGADFEIVGPWVSSALNADGIKFDGAKGIRLVGGQVFGCKYNGVYVENGSRDFLIQGLMAQGNSGAGAGTYDGIRINSNISYFQVIGNNCGASPFSSNQQSYGVGLTPGTSDHYVIQGNLASGNASGGVFDGGSGVNKSVTGNAV